MAFPLKGRFLSLLVQGAVLALRVEQQAAKVPLYRVPRALILDTILGPAEDFDFVSATTAQPPSPPRS